MLNVSPGAYPHANDPAGRTHTDNRFHIRFVSCNYCSKHIQCVIDTIVSSTVIGATRYVLHKRYKKTYSLTPYQAPVPHPEPWRIGGSYYAELCSSTDAASLSPLLCSVLSCTLSFPGSFLFSLFAALCILFCRGFGSPDRCLLFNHGSEKSG